MVDNTSDTNLFAPEQQRGMPDNTAMGVNALKPIVQFQVSLMRMWAASIDRFAGNYEKALDETRREASERAHL